MQMKSRILVMTMTFVVYFVIKSFFVTFYFLSFTRIKRNMFIIQLGSG